MKDQQMYEEVKSSMEYLKKNVNPEDIYLFADQTMCVAAHLLVFYCDLRKLKEDAEVCPTAREIVNHIHRYIEAKNTGEKFIYNKKLDDVKPEIE